ncbi:hypothetical protein [Parapedobacter pyrenivorans]|uniref:hypothetical protein n=1 Tax=Parapedobacter pyrenivorans TaxID=1305674 RepID=UPI00333F8506
MLPAVRIEVAGSTGIDIRSHLGIRCDFPLILVWSRLYLALRRPIRVQYEVARSAEGAPKQLVIFSPSSSVPHTDSHLVARLNPAKSGQ